MSATPGTPPPGGATAASTTASADTGAHLRRLRWAVRATLTLGVAASVAASRVAPVRCRTGAPLRTVHARFRAHGPSKPRGRCGFCCHIAGLTAARTGFFIRAQLA